MRPIPCCACSFFFSFLVQLIPNLSYISKTSQHHFSEIGWRCKQLQKTVKYLDKLNTKKRLGERSERKEKKNPDGKETEAMSILLFATDTTILWNEIMIQSRCFNCQMSSAFWDGTAESIGSENSTKKLSLKLTLFTCRLSILKQCSENYLNKFCFACDAFRVCMAEGTDLLDERNNEIQSTSLPKPQRMRTTLDFKIHHFLYAI